MNFAIAFLSSAVNGCGVGVRGGSGCDPLASLDSMDPLLLDNAKEEYGCMPGVEFTGDVLLEAEMFPLLVRVETVGFCPADDGVGVLET